MKEYLLKDKPVGCNVLQILVLLISTSLLGHKGCIAKQEIQKCLLHSQNETLNI